MTDERFVKASQSLSLGAVAVVGAGLSIDARFPLTVGLNTLLWDALDADPTARADVAKRVGRPDGPSKTLLGDEWNDIVIGWRAVESSITARRRLQTQFAQLDADRSLEPSPAHDGLARLIHGGIVDIVVSLNWDTALEQAYERLFGVNIPAGILFKPHGDAARPEGRWTFPHESGIVPPEVIDAVQKLDERYVRTLLIVGYSESDDVVVDELIAPTDQSWRTIRIGPSAIGPNDIPLGAEEALPHLANLVVGGSATSAWYSVTFRGSRGIEAALRGERLGASDANVCPLLDEVPLLVEALRSDHAVVLNGPAGSGKSVSAYQALSRIASDGFEILRLRDDARVRGISNWLSDLRFFPWPKLLFVDDAQDLSPDTVRELAEHANSTTLVLIVGIDHVAGGVRTFKMGSAAAVPKLANWVRDNREDVFPVVRNLDDHVGEHPRDFHFENRIELASRQPTPWRFFYTLSGGWRRINRDAIELRDHDRADLALLVVAVAQIAGVDAGSSQQALSGLARQLHRDDAWLQRSIAELKNRRLVLEADNRLRCAHLQTAVMVLAWMLHPAEDRLSAVASTVTHVVLPIASSQSQKLPPSAKRTVERSHPRSLPRLDEVDERRDRQHACDLVRFALDSSDTPLRGLCWLADGGGSSRARGVLEWQRVLDVDRYKELANRALATSNSGDVAAAAQLLTLTLSQSRLESIVDIVREHDTTLREWFAAISPQNGWALGDLANSLYHRDPDLAAYAAASVSPERLAMLVVEGGWTHSVSTGQAVDRLCNVGGGGVREAARPFADHDAYVQMFDDPSAEFWRICTLIADLIPLDHKLALRLLEQVGPRIARQFSANPVLRWNDMFDLGIHLGLVPLGHRQDRLPPEVVKAVRSFTSSLDRDEVASAIAGPNDLWSQLNFDGFVYMLKVADPEVFKEVVGLVDMEAFDAFMQRPGASSDRKVLIVASELVEHRRSEVLATFDRLEPDLEILDLAFAYTSPRAAIRALGRGLPLDLGLSHHFWETAAQVVDRLGECDPLIAREVVEANAPQMGIGLASTSATYSWDGLSQWISACDAAAPGLVDETIRNLPEGVVRGWRGGLSARPKQGPSRRKEVEPLVRRALLCEGHVKCEAEALIQQFPSLRRASDVAASDGCSPT
ncbi:hypothetical protein FHT44_002317 [Mycolicibacterium sp. BK634]|uniref:hypothetical protein n=1 Tax=Mycolicibacterium sp. BK634 TaxID=2587099 RepID=UPI001611022F|nr:hypothetical protein [Mycolicibacterium sp. BK634]MBB3749856.1 hypothetical protein [Mycolicibacterium sp. BK634]